MRRYGTYALLFAGVLGVSAAVWLWWRQSFLPLDRLPTANATVARLDFNALRKAGLLSMLAGRPGLEEPEYRSFVEATRFDYQKDLDEALVSFAPDATYFLLRGRFNWTRLETYARANGGSCYEELCHLPGSKPDRRISFLPLGHNLMGMAVAHDDTAAALLRTKNPGRPIDAPKDPVWISIPSSALKQSADLSPGARLLAGAFSAADRVMLTAGAVPDGDYAAHLEAVCRSEGDAKAMTAELQKMTASLKALVRKPDDLAALLMAGTFQQSEKKVIGVWPIQKKMLETLTSGM